MVLGSDAEVLDVGRVHRLFPPAQLKAFWLQDQHCSCGGCSTPVHWIDGGATDLDNAALLCARHHTIVHRNRLDGQIIQGQVVRDRRPDSYRHRRSAA